MRIETPEQTKQGREAAEAYATACEDALPELAADIRESLSLEEFEQGQRVSARSDATLEVLRKEYREFFVKPGTVSYNGWYVTVTVHPSEPPPCTCEGCPSERTCAFAWDTYNTRGDCLADK